ncbi:MAG: GTPase, partial [Candidatus Nanoarchaeia archaeon]
MNNENPKLPIVVIAGRPNVGKSSLFNAICGKRISIVHSESGVTRDRVSAKLAWNNVGFQLIDTGGILFYAGEKFKENEAEINIRGQIEAALNSADIILFVVDITESCPTALDNE